MSTHKTSLRTLSQQYAYASLQLHESIARQAGFSGTDHKYLGFLLQKGKLSAGELAELTGLTTGAVTGLIDRFVQKGLVQRQFDTSDRRKVYLLADTEKIKALLQPFYQAFQDQLDQLAAAYTPAEKEVIGSFLSRSIALILQTNQQNKGIKNTQNKIEASEVYYHGTKVILQPGELITAGYASNYGERKSAKYVYFTATLEAAIWGAELALGETEKIYIVAPTGTFEDDPNLTDKKFPGNPTKSYRTKSALRIIGEVKDWPSHSPEQLQQMRDNIARLAAEGITAIED